MLVSHVNDSHHLRERAAEMRASSKELKDNNTAVVIMRLADLYDRLADRAEMRSNGGVPPGKT
jgi:hypothetical protein